MLMELKGFFMTHSFKRWDNWYVNKKQKAVLKTTTII